MKKITNKDRYTAIIATLTGAETEIATDELVEFCQKQIDALDRKSIKAKEKAAKKTRRNSAKVSKRRGASSSSGGGGGAARVTVRRQRH